MLQRTILGGAAVVMCGLTGVLARPVAAQQTPGEAYAARVAVGGTDVTLARAVLSGTEMDETSLDRISSGPLTSELATAVTTGAADVPGSQSIATVANVNLLDGLIKAGNVIAVATSYAGGTSGAGSGFENLVVNGVNVVHDGNVAPNTRISLPGLGYVVLNEQVPGADGITVNMIHVYLQSLLRRGQVVVASASSGAK